MLPADRTNYGGIVLLGVILHWGAACQLHFKQHFATCVHEKLIICLFDISDEHSFDVGKFCFIWLESFLLINFIILV